MASWRRRQTWECRPQRLDCCAHGAFREGRDRVIRGRFRARSGGRSCRGCVDGGEDDVRVFLGPVVGLGLVGLAGRGLERVDVGAAGEVAGRCLRVVCGRGVELLGLGSVDCFACRVGVVPGLERGCDVHDLARD